MLCLAFRRQAHHLRHVRLEKAGTVRVFTIALSVAISAPSAAQAAEPDAPTLLNLDEVVTPDDYPLSAQRKGAEGTAHIDVRVGKDGLVESCRIAKSSGNIALDEQSCAVFRARARFTPARDRKGRFVAGHFRKPITWRLEGEQTVADQLSPRQAWSLRFTTWLNSSGKVVGCSVDAVGAHVPSNLCEEFSKSPEYARLADEDRAVVAHAISEVQFAPEPYGQAKIPPPREDVTSVGRQILRVEIDGEGEIAECEVMQATGATNPDYDPCTDTPRPRFLADPAGKALKATIIVTGYMKNMRLS